jgi:hypothetical protein
LPILSETPARLKPSFRILRAKRGYQIEAH